ncbi:MAG TPA: acetate--CoA ligase family protein, partial [Candidatus Lustribacter sp.]|nr:acetate--CoA ligase family protein [Candidatus Lustribacter sp.]
GQRIAVVTNSVSLGAITAQSCLSWGLEVTHGPITLAADASVADYVTALESAFADDAVDSVVTCFIPALVALNEDVTGAVKAISASSVKPCVATFLGMFGVTERADGVSPHAPGQTRALPVFAMPEDAVRALAAATRYSQWRAKDHGTVLDPPGVHRAAARSFVEDLLEATPKGRELSLTEATELLAAYGIRLWPSRHVFDADAAVAAGDELGYPVIVKAASEVLRHQPGLRAVQGDRTSAEDVRWAMGMLEDRLGGFASEGVFVQRMATPGVACVLSAIEDPLFGPVLSFSVAGPATDLLGDIGHRIAPLTDVDIGDLLDSIKAAPLLKGHRGAEPVDRVALAELVARVSALADDLPEVEVVELNPVNAFAGGVDVLGARVVVGPEPNRPDAHRRALT